MLHFPGSVEIPGERFSKYPTLPKQPAMLNESQQAEAQPSVSRYILSVVRDLAATKDIVQSTALALLKKFPHHHPMIGAARGIVISRILLSILFLQVPLALLYGAETGRISIRIVDDQGKLTPARAWVDSNSTRLFEPSHPATVTPYARDRSFSCDGVFTINVPIGESLVHVEKGKEYLAVDEPVSVRSGETVEKTITLRRWINMPAEGWYSADLHVHLGHDQPRILRQLSLADDVHLVPAFTYWLRGRGETWNEAWPDASFTTPIKVDDHHIITRNNLEIERINKASIPGGFLGATFLYQLNLPVTAEEYGEHFPTDAHLCRSARTHSPAAVFDCDKPSWAGTAISAALGTLDTVQVCHNHFHRNATIDGGWGMIGPLVDGESNGAEDDALFHRTNALYYRLLNCGFRLGVSGGSAIGVMPVATGQHRVYAKMDAVFSAESFWEAVKSGHSFATSGPMIDLSAGGRGIGSTLSRTSSVTDPISVRGTVRSTDALEALQIVHNGRVVASRDLSNLDQEEFLSATVLTDLIPTRSGWLIARALFRASDGRLRQAHTSPIYLSVDDKPTAFADDARYLLRWVDVLEKIARSHPDRFPTATANAGVMADYEHARSKYESILQDAIQLWGD